MSADSPSTVHRPSVRAGVLAVLLALLLPVLAVSGSSPARASSCDASSGAGTYGGGTGDPGTPYLICSPDHLAHLAATSGHWGKEFRQTADITLSAPASGSSNHTPIGDSTNKFTGVYDGGGFSITGLKIDLAGSNYVGLFGYAEAAILRDIALVEVDVAGQVFVGGLAGQVRSTVVSDVSVTGDVSGESNVGGLVGVTEVIGAGPTAGPKSEVIRSRASVDVVSRVNANGNGPINVGGLIGQVSRITDVKESFATGDVTCPMCTSSSSGLSLGALIGAFYAGTIIDSYAIGSATAIAAEVGGLVGYAQNAVINRSYAVGPVSGTSEVGGLIGDVNASNTTVADSFWDTQGTGQQASAGGSGAVDRSTAEMKSIGTFSDASWSIVAGSAGGPSDVWGICELVNDGYPFLLWEVAGASGDPCSVPEEPVTGSSAAASFVAPGGVLPLQSPGLGEWLLADGSSVPLAVSSPGPNQVRYAADGIVVTFTGGAGSDASRGLVANPNGEVVCEICVALAAGQVIEVWMFSTPRLVAAHLTEDLPCQRFTIPVVAPLDGGGPVSAGAHTLQLALPTASGMQAVNVGVTVGGPVPSNVPAGEGPTVPLGLLAFGLLAAAGAVVAARRQVVAG